MRRTTLLIILVTSLFSNISADESLWDRGVRTLQQALFGAAAFDAYHPDLDSIDLKDAQECDKYALHYLDHLLQQEPAFGFWTDSDKITLHVAGDIFGENSDLEGYTPLKTYAYAQSLFKQIRSSLVHTKEHREISPAHLEDPKILEHLDQRLDHAIRIGEALQTHNPFNALQAIQEGLQENSLVFFPAGWPGHAITIELTRQEDEQFTFRVYNTGDGISRGHMYSTAEGESWILPYIHIEDIPSQKVLSTVFVQALIDLRQVSGHKQKAKGPDDLYSTIISFLGGTSVTPTVSSNQLISPQVSGTCSYYSLIATLTNHLSNPKCYLRHKWEIQLKTVIDFWRQNHHQFFEEEISRKLFEKALTFLANDTLLIYQEGLLSDIELQYVEQWLVHLKEGLNEVLEKLNEELFPQEFAHSSDGYAPFVPHVYGGRFRVADIEVNPISTPHRQSSYSYSDMNIDAWNPQPKTLAEDLGWLTQQIYTAAKSGNVKIARIAIEEAALKLSLDDKYWEDVPGEHAEQILVGISELSTYHLYALLLERREDTYLRQKLSGYSYLTQVKLLAIGNIVSQQFAQALGYNFPFISLKHIEELIGGHSSDLYLENPQWDEEFLKLKSYWESRGSASEDFFHLNRRPAGSMMTPNLMNGMASWERIEGDLEPEEIKRLDILWVHKWMQSPGVREQILKDLPEIANSHPTYQAIYVLSDQKWAYSLQTLSKEPLSFFHRFFGEVSNYRKNSLNGLGSSYEGLPKAFRALRDITFVTDYIVTGHLSPRALQNYEPDLDQGLRYPALHCQKKISYGRTIFTWELGAEIFGIPAAKRPLFAPSVPLHYEDFDDTSIQMSSLQPKSNLKQAHNLIEDPWTSSLIENPWVSSLFEDPDEPAPHPRRLRHQKLSERKRLDTATIESFHQSTRLQEWREIAGLSSDTKIQIHEVIGFYHRHLHLLNEDRHRHLFRSLLLEPGVLGEEIMGYPEDTHTLIDNFLELFDPLYAQFHKINNKQVAIYLLELKQDIFNYIRHYAPHFSEFFHKQWLEIRKELKTQLLSQGLSREERAHLHLVLAYNYGNGPVSENNLTDMMTSILYCDLHATHLQKSHIAKTVSLRDIPLRHRQALHSLMECEGPSILKTLTQRLFKDEKAIEWELTPENNHVDSSFPIYRCKNDDLTTLNIVEGTIDLGSPTTTLPNHLLNESTVKHYIDPDFEAPILKITENTLEVSGKNQERYRIIDRAKQDFPPILQKKINGNWYQRIPQKELYHQVNRDQLTAQASRLFDEIDNPYDQAFLVGLQLLHVIFIDPTSPLMEPIERENSRFQLFKRLLGFMSHKSIENSWLFDLAWEQQYRQVAPLVYNDIWIHIDSNTAIIADPKTQVPLYYVEFRTPWVRKLKSNNLTSPNRLTITSLKPYDSSGNLLNWSLAEINTQESYGIERRTAEYPWVTRIEHPAFVSTWIDEETNKPALIEFPRLGLSFRSENTISGERFMCEQLTPSYLALKQYLPELGDFSNYLVLEQKNNHEKTEQLAIFPRRRPISHHKKSLITPSTVATAECLESFSPSDKGFSFEPSNCYCMDEETERPPLKFITIPIDTQTGKLVPKEQIARFHLALVYLWEHDYHQAYQLLNNYGEFLGPYSADEVEILTEITKMHEWNGDHDPRSKAVRALAYTLLKKHKKYTTTSSNSQSSPSIHQQRYLGRHYQNQKKQAPQKEGAWTLPPRLGERLLLNKDEATISALNYYLPILHSSFAHLSASTRTPTLLRPSLEEYPISAYKVARGQCTTQELKSFLSTLTGISYPSNISQIELEQELRLALELCVSNSSIKDQYEFVFATLLHAVTLAPDLFPKHGDDFPNSEEFFNLIIEAYKHDPYLKKTSRSHQSPTLKGTWAHPTHVEPSPEYKPFNICPQASNPLNLQTPIIENLEEIVGKEVVLETSSNIEELIAAFSIPLSDEFTQKNFNELISQLEHTSPAEKSEYTLHSTKALLDTIKNFENLATIETALQEQRINQILAISNRQPSETIQKSYVHITQIADITIPISLDQVIQSFIKRDLNDYQRLNPSLSLEEAEELNDMVHQYLLSATQLRHIKSILESAQAIVLKEQYDALFQGALAHFYALAKTVRYYDPEEHPEYLVFEYYMNILLRKSQVEALDNLGIYSGCIQMPKHLGAVLEMVMGSGKTSVLLPILALFNSDDDHFPLLVMPKELIPSMSKEIQDRVGPSFSKGIDVIEISYNWPQTNENLFDLRQRFKDALNEHKIVVMSNDSIQTLWLLFLKELSMHSDIDHNGLQVNLSPKTLQDIFLFLKEHAILTIDEVDTIFNILHSHHYAMGVQTSIHHDTIEASIAIFQLLVQQDHLLESRPYDDDIKKQLKDGILSTAFLSNDTIWQNVLQEQSEEEREKMSQYLLGEEESLPELTLSEADKAHVLNILAVSAQQLNGGLAVVLKKQHGTHYGLSTLYEGSAPIAIPHHMGQASTGSLFGTELEIINYTLLSYLKEGISKTEVRKKLLKLQEKIKEITAHYRKNIDEHPAVRAFKDYAGDDADLLILHELNDEEVENITQRINERPELQLEFIRENVLPLIPSYPTQISSNAEIYRLLFDYIQGFTGTLWNLNSYPNVFGTTYSSSTTPETLHLLWKDSPHTIHIIDDGASDLEALLESTYQDRGLKQESLIDLAGTFRHFSQKEVAQSMLKRFDSEEIKELAVVFYNERGLLTAVDKNHQGAVALSQCTTSIESRLAFWDQQHTTGSDIKQGHYQQAIVTVGKHNTLRDLLQAVWRLRGLGHGQSVRFAVMESHFREMIAELNTLGVDVSPSTFSLQHLLLFTHYKQVLKKGDHNFRGLRQRLKGIVLEQLVNAWLDPSHSSGKLIETYKLGASLIEQNSPKAPYLTYGQHHRPAPKEQAIEAELKHWSEHPTLIRLGLSSENIYPMMKALTDLYINILPDWIDMTSTYDKELTIELNVETEQEVEKEVEKEIETEQNISTREFVFQHKTTLPRFPWRALKTAEGQNFSPIPQDQLFDDGTSNLQVPKDVQALGQPVASVNEIERRAQRIPLELSPQLLTSLNYYRWRDGEVSDPLYRSLSHLLIIHKTATDEFQVVLLDNDDAAWFNKSIKDSCGNHDSTHLSLYHLDNGFYRNSAHAPDLSNESLKSAIIQAKFLSGRLHYETEEREILKAWLQTTSSNVEQEYWLPFHGENSELNMQVYKDSILKEVFDEITHERHLMTIPEYSLTNNDKQAA